MYLLSIYLIEKKKIEGNNMNTSYALNLGLFTITKNLFSRLSFGNLIQD